MSQPERGDDPDGRLVFTVAAEWYADHFRRAAARLRQPLSHIEELQVREECGRLIVQAEKLKFLPTIAGLRERIDWHRGEDSRDRKPGTGATIVRCPSNLFLDVVGGHMIRVCNADGRISVVEDRDLGTARIGGILPTHFPNLLRLSVAERAAEGCELLAKLIDRKASATTSDPEADTLVGPTSEVQYLKDHPPVPQGCFRCNGPQMVKGLNLRKQKPLDVARDAERLDRAEVLSRYRIKGRYFFIVRPRPGWSKRFRKVMGFTEGEE